MEYKLIQNKEYGLLVIKVRHPKFVCNYLWISFQIVQFVYGEDSLDPAAMEGNEQPVEFNRLIIHVKAILASECRHEHSLSGEQVLCQH